LSIIPHGSSRTPAALIGFVEMATDEDASKAILGLNKSVFMERELSVAEAKPQQPRERRGFERRKARGGFGRGQGRGRR
jgi:RNA recognition motif-containing protein